MLTPTELKWIRQAMSTDMSPMQAAKTYRVIAQLFEKAAERFEVEMIDRVDERLYNSLYKKEGANNA